MVTTSLTLTPVSRSVSLWGQEQKKTSQIHGLKRCAAVASFIFRWGFLELPSVPDASASSNLIQHLHLAPIPEPIKCHHLLNRPVTLPMKTIVNYSALWQHSFWIIMHLWCSPNTPITYVVFWCTVQPINCSKGSAKYTAMLAMASSCFTDVVSKVLKCS